VVGTAFRWDVHSGVDQWITAVGCHPFSVSYFINRTLLYLLETICSIVKDILENINLESPFSS
jgi:hypothetical protein